MEEHKNLWERLLSLGALFMIAAAVFAVDQWSKSVVKASLAVGEWWAPMPAAWRIFRFTHTTNTGAAFGIFPNGGGVFALIAVVVVVVIVVYYRNLPSGNWFVRVALGLQLAGALGNLVDRLRFGYVTDFVDIGFWPVFNVADSSIVVGVALLAYHLWREDGRLAEHEAAVSEAGSVQ